MIGLDRETLAKDIDGVKEGYDIIIIDGAPQSARLAGAAVKAADLVIVPVTPSPYDVWACSDLVEIIKAKQEVTEGKPSCYFLISRARARTILSTDVKEALAGYGIPLLKSHTIHREVYAQTASNGLTIHSDHKAQDAINEMEQLKNEVLVALRGL